MPDWHVLASPQALAAVVVRAALGYAVVVLVLRVQGNRTLSRLRAFDLVMTIALGSLLGATAVGTGVTVATGAAAILTIVALQTLVARLSRRSDAFHRLVTTRPRLLVHDGRILEEELRAANLRADDVWMAARQQGAARETDVKAVILEPNGEFTVVTADAALAALPGPRPKGA